MSPSNSKTSAPSPLTRLTVDERPLQEKLYEQMVFIRRFEEHLLDRFETGQLVGTTHCYIGQEANAVGVINHLDERDIVFSNHRCHGHFLVYADDPDLLAAELMGRATGVVGGRGGSQHICHHNFYTNGVQGGIVPAATGMALAEKVKGTGAVAVVFIGDGTLGQGVVYESLNMASLWGAPILFVVENNRWAQSTPVERELAGDMVSRGHAFGIDAGEIDSTDAEELFEHFRPIIEKVRATSRPHFEVIHTYRLCHHSKSDDSRPVDEVARFQANEPLPKMRARLSESVASDIEAAALKRVHAAFENAAQAPFPDPAQVASRPTRLHPRGER